MTFDRRLPRGLNATVALISIASAIQHQEASAALIQYEFAGTITSVTDAEGQLPVSIVAGTSTFTGTISYDPEAPDSDSDPDSYRNTGRNTGVMDVLIDGHLRFRRDLDSPVSDVLLFLNNADPLSSGGSDSFTMSSIGLAGASSTHPGLFSRSMLFSVTDSGAKTLFSSDSLTDATLSLSTATNTDFQLNGNNDGGSSTDFRLRGEITSLSLQQQAVPEPSSMALLGIGATGLIAVRRRRQSATSVR